MNVRYPIIESPKTDSLKMIILTNLKENKSSSLELKIQLSFDKSYLVYEVVEH